MKSFVLRLTSLLVIIAGFFSYQVIAVGREKDDQIARLQAEVKSLGGTVDSEKSSSGRTHWKDGTYQGEAQGFGGPIRVSVAVKGGKITAVKVLSHSGEDPSYYSQAEALVPRIVQQQSADIDVVSGATYSSHGILNAVKKALEQAS